MDVHKVTSKAALTGALDAVKAEVRAAGANDNVPTPAFTDESTPLTTDFDKFAAAVSELATRAPQIPPAAIAYDAIGGMIRQSPDCHTYYYDGRTRLDSRPVHPTGDPRPAPPAGTILQGPDEAGLTARMLPGGIAYIRWLEFRVTGTYDIRAQLKAVLDKALAAGAKAWLFDVRGNSGGNGADVIGSWFLNGQPVMKVDDKVGAPVIKTADKDLRLPERYQLPIALIQNDQGGSDPEILALYLKESKRGTIVGGTSIGCVGAAAPTALEDGTEFLVAVEQYSGAVTGTQYNNHGIPPDVQATDAQAIDVASKLLRDEIAKK
ncbi:MAG: S41 family peptidase [Chloroflexi bacterium]|nr:S41 family peptidase [Chloroflexota bacterium]